MNCTPKASRESICYTRTNIFEFVKNTWGQHINNQIAAVTEKLAAEAGGKFELSKENENELRLLLVKLKIKWRHAKRTQDKFSAANADWMKGSITFVNAMGTKEQSEKKTPGKKTGRPSADFTDASDRTKRRRAAERESYSTAELTYAAQMRLRSSGASQASTIVKSVTTHSQERALKYQKALKDAQKPTPSEISADVALNLMITGKMTKDVYLQMRAVTNENCSRSVYPSYTKILAAKNRCYPTSMKITVTETTAEVEVQALLDHTCQRLIEVVNNEINALPPSAVENCTLIAKWGFDGSSGKQYKQKFSEENKTDAHVFFTSLVPVKLSAVDCDGVEADIWINPKPSSTRFCRSVRLQFLKETSENSRSEHLHIENQIKSLVPYNTVLNGRNVTVKHEMIFCMVDLKVKNAVTETASAQRCYICNATTKDFNCIDSLAMAVKKINKEYLCFGISSLHSWIRFMEWLLHVAYKSGGNKKWQACSAQQKEFVAKRKAVIQDKFSRELGLLIDVPKPGFGTTNDGNTARRFFENVSITAEILAIDEDIIARSKVVLQAISSGCAIDTEKFKNYTRNLAVRYVQLYPWYPMPTSVHIVLFHGYDIIKAAPLSIGQLSEDAQEARNKDIRRYRKIFSRKCSHEKTMRDMFNRFLVTSDPLISSLQARKTDDGKPLPPEVTELLLAPPIPDNSEKNGESDVDEDENVCDSDFEF